MSKQHIHFLIKNGKLLKARSEESNSSLHTRIKRGTEVKKCEKQTWEGEDTGEQSDQAIQQHSSASREYFIQGWYAHRRFAPPAIDLGL